MPSSSACRSAISASSACSAPSNNAGWIEVRIERLVDHRAIEMRQRLVAGQQLDPPHRAKLAAVIETELRRQGDRAAAASTSLRLGGRFAEQRRRLIFPGGREPRDGMQRQRLIGKP